MRRINKKIKALWGVSEIGFGVMSMMETTFLLFFLTDVAMLPREMAAFISATAAIADAVCAIPSGILIDKLNLSWGKYRPWLLLCPPIVTVLFVLCFTKIGSDTMAAGIIIAAYIASHFIWTISWNANRGLISVITDDPDEISFLSGRIALGTTLGKILASFFVPFMSTEIGKVTNGVTSYMVTCAITCLIFMVCYYTHYFITAGYDNTPVKAKKTPRFKDMARSICCNPHLVAVLSHDALRLVAFYGIAAAAAYYVKIIIGDASVLPWLLTVFYAGTSLGSGISSKISSRLGVRGTSVLGCVGCALIHGSCFFVGNNMVALFALLFLAQSFFGLAYGLTSTLYSMCGTYSQWKTGESVQGVVMSFGALSIKIAIAIRGVLISTFLGLICYDPTVSVVSAQASNGIRFLFLIVFSVVMLLSIIPLAFFRLNGKMLSEMESDIALRASQCT